MSLAGTQSNRPRLPPLPQGLPKTQADWQAVVNALQQWQKSIAVPKWISPTLKNGWLAYGSEYEPPGYYMDVSGRVYLRGLVKSGSTGAANPIFTLPAGYVPPYTPIFPVISNDTWAEIRIGGVTDTGAWGGPGGVVIVAGGSNAWVSLAGISFSTRP